MKTVVFNGESAVNVLVVRQVGSAEACFGEISPEDVPSFAKVGFPHLVASLEVRGGVRIWNCVGPVYFEGQNVQEEEEEEEGPGEAGAEAGTSCFGEKAPGASFVTVALADFLTDFFICLHFCFTSCAAC